MKTFKKVLSVVLALTMVLGLITVTNVSAAGGDIILEDFSTFTIGSSAITSSSGFDISAGADAYTDTSVMSVSGEAVHVNGNPNKVAKDSSLFFDFPETASGKVYISYDIKMGSFWMSSTNPGHAGDAFFAIGDKNITDMSTTSANTIASLKSAGNNEAGTNTIGIGNYNGSTLYAAKDVTTWHSVEYVIDMDNSTYDFTFDGVTYEGIAFQNSLSSISRIAFVQHKSNWYNNTEFYLDNVKCINNLNRYAHTVTFMNGSEEYATKTVYETVAARLPIAPSDGDKQFLGWFTADGEEVTAASISNITEDMVVYAQFRGKLYLTEDFSSFTIDTANKTMTTSSGFTFSGGDGAYSLVTVKDGGLYMNGRQAAANNVDGRMYIDFPSVTSGKLNISLKLKTDNIGYQNWIAVTEGKFIGIGDKNTGVNAAMLYQRGIDTTDQTNEVWLATSKGSSGATTNVIGSLYKNQDYVTLTYTLDLDNKTYDVTWNGTTVSGVAFENEVSEINRIYFNQRTGNSDAQYANYNWTIDDVAVIEDPESHKYTVTFMNGNVEFATASAMKNSVIALPAEVPTAAGKAFLGWFTADDTEVTDEVLSQIAANGENVTLYAKFRSKMYLTEEFGNGFSLGTDKDTITTTSGFSVSAENDIGYNILSLKDGALTADGYSGAGAQNLNFDFPAIYRGKVYIALDIKISNPGLSNAAFAGRNLLAIGNQAGTAYAANITRAYSSISTLDLTSGNGNALATLTKNADYTKIEYTLDLDNQTYTLTIDGAVVENNVAFTSSVDHIDRIAFVQGNETNTWYNNQWTIDNLTVVEDPDSQSYTVTFMNGDEVYNTATALKNNTVKLPATVPTAEGKVFLGWFTADDAEVTDAVLSQIAASGENVTIYAKFRDNLNITEDFSNFTIDAENKTMTTSSGLTFSGGDGAYSLVTVTDGGLYMNGRQAAANDVDGRMYIDFPSVTSGKLNISLKLKTDNIGYQNWIAVMEGKFIGIGDKNTGVNAAMLYQRGIDTTGQNSEVWLATSKGSSGATTNVIGSLYQNQDYVTLTYTLDLDNKTYDVTWNGTKISGVAFENEVSEINRIYFNQRTGNSDAQYANYNWTIDDVAVVEGDIAEPTPTYYTVTFVDYDDSVIAEVQVEEGKDAAAPEDPTREGYTFAGWEGTYTNVTGNVTVKATYTKNPVYYTVTFVDYDDSVIAEVQVEEGKDAAAPEDPTRNGYTFAGWEGTYTNVTGNVTVKATYTKNEVEYQAYIESSIEPMSNAEFKTIMGEDIPEGYYAWKIKHSDTGLNIYRAGSKMAGYYGYMLANTQINLKFGDALDDVYYYAQPIEEECTVPVGSNYGLSRIDNQNSYNTFWDDSCDPAYAYPFSNTTVTSCDNIFVTLLVTKTNTFDITVESNFATRNYLEGTSLPEVIDGKFNEQIYNTDVDFALANGYAPAGLKPEHLTVVDGTITSGGVEGGVEITFVCGDVNGDGVANGVDASLIMGSTTGGGVSYGDYDIGAEIVNGIICGDVNGDGVANGVDASLIMGSTTGGGVSYGDYDIGETVTIKK